MRRVPAFAFAAMMAATPAWAQTRREMLALKWTELNERG